MNGINLLPWREEKRQEYNRQIISSGVLIWILCGVAIFAVYSYLQLLQENQSDRNSYLNEEIKSLNVDIEEIQDFEKRRNDLVSRMETIQSLQRERSQLVQILNEIVITLPEGVYFDSVSKKGQDFNFVGVAQSNALVSNLMEIFGASKWFHDPDLDTINISPGQGERLSQFGLKVTQRDSRQAGSGEAEAQGQEQG